MPQSELVKRMVDAMNAAGIDYMLTGSMASSVQGEPRATHDIDFVAEIRRDQVEALLNALPKSEYYTDAEAIHEAIQKRRMFNVVDLKEGDKVDIWMLKDDPYDRARFGRKVTEQVFGMALHVSAPEDTILFKLRWAAMSGGSEKQYRDALRVYEVQQDRLDHDYMKQWAAFLGVTEALDRVRSEAQTL